jgi:hypothetical protein
VEIEDIRLELYSTVYFVDARLGVVSLTDSRFARLT